MDFISCALFYWEEFSMKDQETTDKFVEMRAKGMSFSKIAEQLNTSKQTLINWSKDLDEEIANLKAIELESLIEKHYMSKEKRIELYGKTLKDINAELEKRKISDLNTKELYTLMIKIDSILQREKTEPIFKDEKDTSSIFDYFMTPLDTLPPYNQNSNGTKTV